MAKVNIRESLGRIDLLTDNKYDLRNTYDSSNLSNDKKKMLAESISKNASAKQLHDILNEKLEEDFSPALLELSIKSALSSRGFDNEHGYSFDFITNEDGTLEAQLSDGLDWKDYQLIKRIFRNSGVNVYQGKEHKDGGLLSVVFETEPLTEDTVKQNGKWVNKGEEGTHGKFKTKKEADAQRKAMFANGYKAEALKEANYGGAYDIDPEMFWTKDDLIEFSDAVCDKLTEKFGYQYDIADVGAESNNDMYILIEDTTHGIEADVSFRIKMSRIRAPRDLMKYLDTVVSKFVKKFEEEYQYYDFDESLNEDMSAVMDDFAYARRNWDRIGTGVSLDDALEEYNAQYGQEGFYARPLYSESEWNKMVNMFADVETITEAVDDEEIDLDVETDFNDGEVEEGDTFIEDGREWSWIERIAGPIHLDFDNWAVWSARDWDYIQEKIKPILTNKEELTVETLTKIYDEAEVAYFVVDEDTGFIDWGPVESQTEAQDFLNGKVEDWENDEYDESLKESKDLKEWWTVDLDYEDIGSYGYTYEADGEEVVDYLTEMLYENGEYPDFLEDKSDEEISAWLDDKENYPKFRDWVEENIDDLLKKYEYVVMNYFEDKATMKYFDEHEDDDWEYGPDNGSGMTDRDFL